MADGYGSGWTPEQWRRVLGPMLALSVILLAGRHILAKEPVENGPGQQAIIDAFFTEGRVQVADPNALDQWLGEPVTVFVDQTELRVTPTRATTGTGGCASGPRVTVDLTVEPAADAAVLALGKFQLRTADGSVVGAVTGCSEGFGETTGRLSVVFEAERPDWLILANLTESPEAMWQLQGS
ncbi:hypothetical protein FHR83_003193 [Actinoplanes campanulatus]|uniref:Uncharacterized protein n=1 Tax=Actinoplanes campanulatus TaxID=113559 RepID=A0A7W5AFZ5_9ACTN|nr:hypothetical protein [Actinoplanes campanulatus]MBB3095523.1 hypothetical protein [Actinoplanes campanulatus]GGN09593.1 hypothetical protein GCM10010109_18960 [Actinoplanes campanulatus]GID36414.1 hypothetical protein Aca09nite_29200 [Actinoplanes campanulatus]